MWYVIESFNLSGNSYVRYKYPTYDQAREKKLEIYRRGEDHQGSWYLVLADIELSGGPYEIDDKVPF